MAGCSAPQAEPYKVKLCSTTLSDEELGPYRARSAPARRPAGRPSAGWRDAQDIEAALCRQRQAPVPLKPARGCAASQLPGQSRPRQTRQRRLLLWATASAKTPSCSSQMRGRSRQPAARDLAVQRRKLLVSRAASAKAAAKTACQGRGQMQKPRCAPKLEAGQAPSRPVPPLSPLAAQAPSHRFMPHHRPEPVVVPYAAASRIRDLVVNHPGDGSNTGLD